LEAYLKASIQNQKLLDESLSAESDLDLNKPSSIVEKLEANNDTSLSNRIYLHRRQTLVKKFSISSQVTGFSPMRKASGTSNSLIPLNFHEAPNKRQFKKSKTTAYEKPTLLNSQSSFESQEEASVIDDQDESNSEISGLVSWNDKKTNSEMESSRLMFSMNSNILGTFEVYQKNTDDDMGNSEIMKNSELKKDSSRHIEFIYTSDFQAIDEILGGLVRKSVIEENFNNNRKTSNLTILNRNKLNLIQVPNIAQDPWLHLTGWSSFQNFLALLPKTHEFHEISNEILTNSRPWKEILFKSLKEYCSGFDFDNFPDLNPVFKTNLSGLQTLVLMKFFRSDEMERLIKGFATRVFPSVFSNIRKEFGLEKVLKQKSTKPLLILYNDLTFDLKEVLENKSFGLNNRRGVKKLVINSFFSKENLMKTLDDILEEKLWIIIENFHDLKRGDFESFVKILSKKAKSIENTKMIIFYKLSSKRPYEPFDFIDKNNAILLSFFNTCQKIFIQEEKSLKDFMKNLYMSEREEYKAQTHKKTLPATSNPSDKTAPSIKHLKCFSYEILHHRNLKLKENSNQFFNLHSLIDSKELLNKNASFLSVIDAQSKKIRFSLYFLYAMITLREKFEFTELTVISKKREFLILIEDLFQFLETFALNPLVFLEKALSYIFQNLKKNYDFSIFSSLFKEYIITSQEKQLILSIKNHKYELYKPIGNMSYEENVTKTVLAFPEEDHLELLGFHLNLDFQYNFSRAEKVMVSLRKFEQNFNKMLKKEETIRIFLENPHSFKEFLLAQEKFYSKALKKADKLQDLLLSFDLEQSINIKSNLYTNLLEILKLDDISFDFPFDFTEDILIDQPLISATQVYNWLVETGRNSPTRSPQLLNVNRPESPGKLKKTSVLFSPASNADKRSSQVRFEITKKTPVLYRSPTSSNINTLIGTNNIKGTNKQEIPRNKNFGINNKVPSLKNIKEDKKDSAEESNMKSHERIIENKISEDVVKSIVLSEFLIVHDLRKVIAEDVGALLGNLTGRTGVLLNEKLKKVEKMIGENKTPMKWLDFAFTAEKDEQLSEFCRNLIMKMEHCQKLINEPKILQNSIVNLARMFDPLAFLYFLLWDYSIDKKVNLRI